MWILYSFSSNRIYTSYQTSMTERNSTQISLKNRRIITLSGAHRVSSWKTCTFLDFLWASFPRATPWSSWSDQWCSWSSRRRRLLRFWREWTWGWSPFSCRFSRLNGCGHVFPRGECTRWWKICTRGGCTCRWAVRWCCIFSSSVDLSLWFWRRRTRTCGSWCDHSLQHRRKSPYPSSKEYKSCYARSFNSYWSF